MSEIAERPWLVRAREAAAAKRRAATHCKRGHPWNEENTYISPNGKRNCRACRRITDAENRAWTFKQLMANPLHPSHGTSTGARSGCRCYRCRVYEITRKSA